MSGIALTRRFVAVTVAGFACGGVAWAAAAVMPVSQPGPGHRTGVDVTSVAPDSTTIGDQTTTTVAGDTTTTLASDTTTTVADTTTTSSVAETTTTLGGTTTTTMPCNHGLDVSSVAHSAPRGHDAGRGAHGKAVSAVAHTKCPGGDGNDSDTPDGNDSAATGTSNQNHGHGDHQTGAGRD